MAKTDTKNINPKVYALKKGTIYKSGKNPNATVNKTPTTYKGGKMSPPTNAKPAGKGVTKSTMSKSKKK